MGLFKSLKGKVDVGTDDADQQYTPPQGPPPSQRRHHQQRQQHEDFAPPPGPPPTYRPGPHAPVQGPGQGQNWPSQGHARQNPVGQEEDFAPPPGPPPSHGETENETENGNANPPPYHDWTVIPDTSLLPPPPPLPQDSSPTNNASYDSAARAHAWCARYAVYTPSVPTHELHLLANAGHINLEAPPAPLNRAIKTLKHTSPSTWHVATARDRAVEDTLVVTSVPTYFARQDHPLHTGAPKTIYFELHILRIRDANSGIAVGYAAKPYPPWRLPGWHRASWAVHGDDGRRFVNDPWGGRDFAEPFREGDVVGVGMRFEATAAATVAAASGPSPGSGKNSRGRLQRVKTRAFMTRNGRTDERWSWDMDEERDERDEGIDGLMGDGDLYPAIGFFGTVEFEVRFGQSVAWTGAGN